MRRVSAVVLASSLLLVGPAFGQSTDEFVKKVAISDMFEVESSQLALSKKPDRDTAPFAKRMVKDHTKTTRELKTLVQAGKVKAELPSALDAEHKKKLDDLRSLEGKPFDTAYDQAQREGHQQAVALFESYAKNGDNADLKKWAAKTLPHLKMHLTMAQKLK
jgi:putative membrane protein